ncbi:hypothetical protein D3C77_507180 [compost metagenome]
MPSAIKLGNPNNHKNKTDNTAFTKAIRNCTSIILPKDNTNFLPKYSKSANKNATLLSLNFAVKVVTFSFSNKRNKLRIIATNKFILHFPMSVTVFIRKSNPLPK